MNLFQWITLPILGVLLLVDLRNLLVRRPVFRKDRVFRCLIWFAAGVAIYEPGITVIVANAIGIHRGADLVLYVFCLAFLAASSFFYSRLVRMERQMTELVRHIAIKEARSKNMADEFVPTNAAS